MVGKGRAVATPAARVFTLSGAEEALRAGPAPPASARQTLLPGASQPTQCAPAPAPATPPSATASSIPSGLVCVSTRSAGVATVAAEPHAAASSAAPPGSPDVAVGIWPRPPQPGIPVAGPVDWGVLLVPGAAVRAGGVVVARRAPLPAVGGGEAVLAVEKGPVPARAPPSSPPSGASTGRKRLRWAARVAGVALTAAEAPAAATASGNGRSSAATGLALRAGVRAATAQALSGPSTRRSKERRDRDGWLGPTRGNRAQNNAGQQQGDRVMNTKQTTR